MTTKRWGKLVGAVALGFTVQACSPDGTQPVAPEAGTASFTVGSEGIIEVTKTAHTFWNGSKTYDWDVTKKLTSGPLVLGQGESGIMSFAVSATRVETGSSTGSYGMSGEICVTNNTSSPTVDLWIEDRFYGPEVLQDLVVDVSGNPVLDPGESHCYPYSFEMDPTFVPDPSVTYQNKGYVFETQVVDGQPKRVRTGETTNVTVEWPTDPSEAVVDGTATVVDLLTCPAGFSCTPTSMSWTFSDSGTQALNVVIKNVSAPCGQDFDVVNRATLTEGTSGTVRGPAVATGVVDTVECTPPPSIHGCTPGYWKQPQHFDSWVGFTQAQDFDTVFGVSLFSPDRTLLQALSTGGGKANRLGRHAVAALLNTSNSGVEYGMTTAQVVQIVQQAVASGDYDLASEQFEKLNERGCPLN